MSNLIVHSFAYSSQGKVQSICTHIYNNLISRFPLSHRKSLFVQQSARRCHCQWRDEHVSDRSNVTSQCHLLYLRKHSHLACPPLTTPATHTHTPPTQEAHTLSANTNTARHARIPDITHPRPHTSPTQTHSFTPFLSFPFQALPRHPRLSRAAAGHHGFHHQRVLCAAAPARQRLHVAERELLLCITESYSQCLPELMSRSNFSS